MHKLRTWTWVGLVSLLAAHVAVGQSFTANQKLLHAFGQSLLSTMPPEVRNGTDVQKARFAFTAYCDRLALGNAPVNDDAWTRLQQTFGNFNPSQWTCGDHTANLTALFQGVGIRPSNIEEVETWPGPWRSQIPTPNVNHGAPGIRAGNDLVFFDAWQLAHTTRSYANAATSKWNGMPSSAWEQEMRAQGYSRFTRPLRDVYYDSLQQALDAWLGQRGRATQGSGAKPAADGGEAQVLAEYQALLPAVLQAEKKPWQTRIEIVANAARQAGGYHVNYRIYCLIESGPDQGKDHMCSEFEGVFDLGQLKTAVADFKRRLGR